jgi:hypothetical protein
MGTSFVSSRSRARKLDYLPLTTLDGDVAVPPKLKKEESDMRKRLLDAGFDEEFVGEDRPPATHYHYGKGASFYAEFLALSKEVSTTEAGNGKPRRK